MHHTSDIWDERGEDFVPFTIQLQNLGGRKQFHGRVRTVRVLDENLLIKQIMREQGEGNVLVVDGGGSLQSALLGGNMVKALHDHGWAGVIVHGAIRDRHEIVELPIGVMALGSNPRRSSKRGAGEVDNPLRIGGVDVLPGKWIYADDDGVLVERA